MEKQFYGTKQEFLDILKKQNIGYNLINDKIIIGDGYINIYYRQLPIRSFSVVKFPKDGLVLELVDISKEVSEKINKICLAYNNDEIGAIYRDMPVIDWYSNNNQNTLSDVAIIWRDHFLEENIGLLHGFVKMGVLPNNILAIDKGDSTKHHYEITETFKKLGYNVGILDNSVFDMDDLLKDGEKLITDFIEKRLNMKIVILDDGAIVTKILDKVKYNNILGVVELTEMGLRRIRPNENELLYPVLNVAKTKLKRNITYTEISNTIFIRIIELLQAEKCVGRSIVLCGYGDLGEILADRLRNYGIRVTIVDPDVLRLIVAAERGYTTYRDCYHAVLNEKPFMIVGASGYKSITEDAIDLLPDYAYITAGATADLYYFKEFEKNSNDYIKVDKYGTQYLVNGRHIDVLGNGRSVNLFDSEAIPNKSNDIFKCAQLVTVNNLNNNKCKLNNKINVNIVDEWIDESGILDKYYDLYMEK